MSYRDDILNFLLRNGPADDATIAAGIGKTPRQVGNAMHRIYRAGLLKSQASDDNTTGHATIWSLP